jgi:succinate-semialdehyde dehydrogenase
MSSKMSSKSLLDSLQSKAYINGEWRKSSSNKTFKVFNPSNGELIGESSDCDVNDANDAINAAKNAFQEWSETTAKHRSQLLRKLFELQMSRQQELAQLLTLEMGKPIKESMGEIAYGASFLEWFAEEAKRVNGEIIQSPWKEKMVLYTKEPIGVVAIIVPWNFPNAMITRKLGAVLATGCTAVIRPSEDTPYSALAIAKLAEEAGFPKGVINVVPTSRINTSSVGKTLCQSTDVSALSFTGSTAVGKILLEQSASTVKRVCLELGGNAPFIVFDSANVDKAVEGCIASKFRNAGQTCVCANRIYVQSGIYDTFVAKLAQKMAQELIVGDGSDSNTTIGPLINYKAVEKVQIHVNDAITKGGNLVYGGKHIKGNFFEPTLITNVNTDMQFSQEETFGPLAGIFKFKTEDEVLSLANASRVGLAGYFYSNEMSQIWRVAKRLQVGMIGVNEGIISTTEAPFGGVKESGLGREGSHFGTDEFVNIKYICLGGL